MHTKRIQKLVRFAVLLAISVIVHFIESLIPIPFMCPGVKLGLANAVGLLVLAFWGRKDFAAFGFLRVLLVGVLRTGLFSTAFFLSLSGTTLSMIATILVFSFTKASVRGISIVGSLFHGLGQILAVCVIYSNGYMISYLPVLLVANLITGYLLSLIIKAILERLPASIYNAKAEA